MLQADEPVSLDDVQNLIAYARTLLTPSEVGNAFEKVHNASSVNLVLCWHTQRYQSFCVQSIRRSRICAPRATLGAYAFLGISQS